MRANDKFPLKISHCTQTLSALASSTAGCIVMHIKKKGKLLIKHNVPEVLGLTERKN
jgi:hypothetical protein